jgi:hypothetical protein
MSPTTDQPAYAVMQDDTVLCADCITQVCDDRQPADATLVHAWLSPDHGQTCSWCGASSELPAANER